MTRVGGNKGTRGFVRRNARCREMNGNGEYWTRKRT